MSYQEDLEQREMLYRLEGNFKPLKFVMEHLISAFDDPDNLWYREFEYLSQDVNDYSDDFGEGYEDITGENLANAFDEVFMETDWERLAEDLRNGRYRKSTESSNQS